MLKMRKIKWGKNTAEDNSFEDTTATLQWLIGRLEPRPLFWMSPGNAKFCAMGDGHRYRSRPLRV